MKTKLILGTLLVTLISVIVWLTPDNFSYTTKIQNKEKGQDGLPPIELVSKTVTFEDKSEATFRIAEGFEIAIAAEKLGKARFMAMSPDGRLFVADLVNQNLSHDGRVIILDDFNPETKKFETKTTYLSGLRGANSVAFYRDKSGKIWLYVALTDRLIRYPYKVGDNKPSGEAEVIAKFPDFQSPTAVGVVWHITRTILFHDDKLYVSVGSGCNVCEQPEDEVRAVILVMDPDGKNVKVHVDGIKNAVGMAFADGQLYATENGVDHLGPEDPDDLFYRIEEGKHYGWPYCYESAGVKQEDKTQVWKRQPISCADIPMSLSALEPHSAPLGVAYFEKFNKVLDKSFLIALHGSFQPKIGNGYQLMRVSKKGAQEVFMDDFLNEAGERVARPVDIFQKDESSFFFTDDFGGRLFYVYAK